MITATIRDIAIIIIAIQSIVIGAMIGILIWQVWRLIKMLQTEVKPIVDDVQDTVGTVRGTANFVSRNVTDPVVRSGRTVAKWRGTIQALRRDLHATRPVPRSAPPPAKSSSPPPAKPTP